MTNMGKMGHPRKKGLPHQSIHGSDYIVYHSIMSYHACPSLKKYNVM